LPIITTRWRTIVLKMKNIQDTQRRHRANEVSSLFHLFERYFNAKHSKRKTSSIYMCKLRKSFSSCIPVKPFNIITINALPSTAAGLYSQCTPVRL
jgi:hypothetical protein